MRRLLFLYTPLVEMGGAQRNFLQEVDAFSRRGDTCQAMTFASGADGPDAGDLGVESLIRIPRRDPITQVTALRRTIRTFKPDLLVAHTSPELAYFATLGTGVPYVLYLNSPPFYTGYPGNRTIYARRYARLVKRAREAGGPRYAEFLYDVRLSPLQRLDVEIRAAMRAPAVKHAAAHIVWSRRSVEEVRQVYGVTPVVLRGCIPDALPAHIVRSNIRDRVGLPSDRQVVLTVSRLDPVKRVDLLIRAFHLVKAQCPRAALVIAGIGPDEGRLRALAADLGTQDVRFAGYVPDEGLWDAYATSDLFATPALADFNITPFEALALRCRVLWSNEMEADPALRASGAVTAAEPTPQDFARAMTALLGSPATPSWDITPYLLSTRYASLSSLFDRVIQSHRVAVDVDAARR